MQSKSTQDTLSRRNGQPILQAGDVKAAQPLARTPGLLGHAWTFWNWR